MRTEDVVELYTGLLAQDVRIWLDGGWGIDALLGRRTRPHKDLDAIIAFEDLPTLARFLRECGFARKEIWPDNRWAPCPELLVPIGREHHAIEVATAFVLADRSGRELDVHVVCFDENGRGTPAWNSDFVFSAEAFEGVGSVGGMRVRCLSAETQMRTHTGYALGKNDVHDLRLLNDRFGIAYPGEIADLLSSR